MASIRSRQASAWLTRLCSAQARQARSVTSPFRIPASPQARRHLSISTPLLKKKKSQPVSAGNSSPSSSKSSPSSGGSSAGGGPPAEAKTPPPDPEKPLDFSSLTTAWAPQDAHFKSQLQIITHGGRFNPDSLGALPVHIKSSAAEVESFPLRELAQVVPRSGRNISLLVNDREYIKPIISAVQGSKDFNQQPQRAPDNDLELLMKVEVERRDEVVKRVKECCQEWKERVRKLRTRHEKTLKEWKKDGTVLPDVVRKAEKELQKVQDRKMKEIDGEEAQVIKQLDRH